MMMNHRLQMNRLLIPLLVVLALPIDVNAESSGLLIAGHRNNMNSITNLGQIEMPSMEACKVEGEKVKNDQYYRKGIFSNINYTCVTGK